MDIDMFQVITAMKILLQKKLYKPMDNLENPIGSRSGHPRLWKGSIARHKFVQKYTKIMYMASLVAIACRKIDALRDSRADAVVLFRPSIFAAGKRHREASLNKGSGDIKSVERQWKWRKLKWRVNEKCKARMRRQLAASETNACARTRPPLLRVPFSAGRSMGFKKSAFLGALHFFLWAQIWFTNGVRNPCSKRHRLERGGVWEYR